MNPRPEHPMPPLPDTTQSQPDPDLTEAMRLLGKSELLLAIHDSSFPGVAGEDTGRGTPYGEGALALAGFARQLGFTGLQLGPQGQTSPVNPSPYDGSLFSRNLLSLDLKSLVHDDTWQGLLDEATWQRIIAGNPRPDGCRVAYAYAGEAFAGAAEVIRQRFAAACQRGDPDASRLAAALRKMRRENRWLRDDLAYEALCLEHGHLSWQQWPNLGIGTLDRVLAEPPARLATACATRRQALEQRHAGLMEGQGLIQLILLEQHRAFRERLRALGLKVYGDAQIGISLRDAWSRQALLLPGYLMGAPPSRSNIDGQPWGYPVLDPESYSDAEGGPGAGLDFFAERIGKLLAEFDGLRLDHPHGLVCPWVYRADDPDPHHAVQHGARLFDSPDLADHPALARYAIALPGQLDRVRPRFADAWVRDLTAQQEDRYAVLFDALMAQVLSHGRSKQDILCEVLSTEPLPLRRVRERHGLGRFRVTQKADLDNPDDVYRSENARAEDWIMVGNHDTPPIWRLTRSWQDSQTGRKLAGYLARRLRPADPTLLAVSLAVDYRKLAHAMVADLFLSPACQVMLFFADLFGLEAVYNVPGTQNEENWTLRVPPDFSRRHAELSRRGEALNLHAALALALRARPDTARPELIARLEARAGWIVG
jgi:4-alpha-glucanotransferase